MSYFHPGNAVATGAMAASWLGLSLVMLMARRAPTGEAATAKRDTSSVLGIALQSVGIGAAWSGPIRIHTDWP